MKLRKKKGFTIIELVIVIAVIGILTAILVPTFINLTNKANEAADDSLVKNLNTALKMEEVLLDNPKNETLQDAIDDLENEGYLLENLISKSGKDLLWNQPKNEFVLNKEGGYSGKDYWQIVKEVPAYANQKYSYYAGKQFNTNVPNLKYGFDAGTNIDIVSVTYVGKTDGNQEVAIRTNGGSLIVNANEDIVKHYGVADDVSIKAIDIHSYHEHGKVPYIEIKEGHVKLESGASVQAVHFLKNEANKFEDIKVSYESNVTLPTFSRDGGVDIDESNGTLVAEVAQEGQSSQFIILTLNGIFEQIKIAEDKAGTESVWADDTSVSETTQTIASQIANNFTGKSYGEYDLTDADIDPVTRVLIDETKATEGGKDAETVKNSTEAVITGEGTEQSPFVIKDSRTYIAFAKLAVDGVIGSADKTTHVKCVGTIDLSGVELDARFNICNVSIDGKNDNGNAKFINMQANNTNWRCLFGEEASGENNAIKNITVEDSFIGRGLVNDLQGQLVIDNVKIKNTDGDHTVFVAQLWASDVVKSLTIKNCTAENVYISGASWGTAGFVGYNATNGTINIEDSTFLGTVNSSAGGVTGAIVGQQAGTLNCRNVRVLSGSIVRGLGNIYVGAFIGNASTNYNNNGNSFNGKLEVVEAKVNTCHKNGFNNTTIDSYVPTITSGNLSILDGDSNIKTNEAGNVVVTYTGSNTVSKLKIKTELLWVDSVYYGSYPRQLNRMVYCAETTATNVETNGEIDTAFKYITNIVNVVNENQSSYDRIGGQSTDTTKLAEDSEFNVIGSVMYYDAREAENGWADYISKSDKTIRIEVSALDENDHVISSVTLTYNFTLGLE